MIGVHMGMVVGRMMKWGGGIEFVDEEHSLSEPSKLFRRIRGGSWRAMRSFLVCKRKRVT